MNASSMLLCSVQKLYLDFALTLGQMLAFLPPNCFSAQSEKSELKWNVNYQKYHPYILFFIKEKKVNTGDWISAVC